MSALIVSSNSFLLDHKNLTTPVVNCICCLAENASYVRLDKCKHKLFLLELIRSKQAIDLREKAICIYCHRFLQKVEKFKQLVQRNIYFTGSSSKTCTQPSTWLKSSTLHVATVLPIRLKMDDLTRSEDPLQQIPECKKEPRDVSKDTAVDEIIIKAEEDSDVPDDAVEHIDVKIEWPDVTSKPTGDVVERTEVKTERGSDGEKLEAIGPVEESKGSGTVSEKELTHYVKEPRLTEGSETKLYGGRLSIVTLDAQQVLAERELARKSPLYANKEFQCEWCIKGFLTKRALENHMERHDPKFGPLLCSICNSYNKTDSSQRAHYRRHFTRYECAVCKQRFMSELVCCGHYSDSHGKEHGVLALDLGCRHCDFTTDSYRALRRHCRKHSKGHHECGQCYKIFVTASGLATHARDIHGKEKPAYRCRVCDKVYRTAAGLRSHTSTKHPTGESAGEAYCAECDTSYLNQSRLNVHLRTHSRHAVSEAKLICDYCGCKLRRKVELRQHICTKHMPIHKCSLCSKSLSTPSALRRHVGSVHLGMRAPQDKMCQYCGKGFSTNVILQSHIRTHTRERPHKCPHCPATFAHSAARYTHIKLLHNPDRVRKQKQPGKKHSNQKQSNDTCSDKKQFKIHSLIINSPTRNNRATSSQK